MFVQFLLSFTLLIIVVPIIFVGVMLMAPHSENAWQRLRRELWYNRVGVQVYVPVASFLVALSAFGAGNLLLVYLAGCFISGTMGIWWITESSVAKVDVDLGPYLVGVTLASYVGISLVLSRTLRPVRHPPA